MRPSRLFVLPLALLGAAACKDEKAADKQGTPPPPAIEAAAPGACASGGGTVNDPVSAPFFPRKVHEYCIDPQGDVKTYGDQGKLTMDEVCTTAFDGECEVYKRFGLKRVVALRYIDGAGGGGSVEINLSTFATVDGAYGMYTKRVIADADPADEHAPKPIGAGGAGAIGSGRGYVWKGTNLVELTYINEQESPEQLVKASEGALTPIAKALGEKLTGQIELPPAARALPEDKRIPGGVQLVTVDPLGLKGQGPGAVGYYKDGTKRYRLVAIVKDDADQAKDTVKALKARPGALPIAPPAGTPPGQSDDALQVVLQDTPSAPRAEYVFARKGTLVAGVGDETLVLKPGEPLDRQADLRLTKDEKLARLRAWLAGATPPPAASAGGAPAASSAPKPAAGAPSKAPPAPSK